MMSLQLCMYNYLYSVTRLLYKQGVVHKPTTYNHMRPYINTNVHVHVALPITQK